MTGWAVVVAAGVSTVIGAITEGAPPGALGDVEMGIGIVTCDTRVVVMIAGGVGFAGRADRTAMLVVATVMMTAEAEMIEP